MAAPLPLAAGLDWLEGILPLLFLLFWILSQVRNLFAGGAKPPGPVVVRPMPRPPIDEERHRELARQVEEFLRSRSSGGQAAPRQEPGPRLRDRGVRPQGGEAPPPLPGGRTPPKTTRGRTASRPAVATDAPPQRPLGSLGGHAADVARHVEGAFASEIHHLPSGLVRPDAGTADAPAAVATPPVDIAGLLRNPATLRQLVLVREVLDRPVDRW